jgi:hypothetical protein
MMAARLSSIPLAWGVNQKCLIAPNHETPSHGLGHVAWAFS